MKTPVLTSTVAAAMVLLTVSFCATVQALSGAGTELDPWQIASVADFGAYCANPNYWDDHARLDANLDLTGITYTSGAIAPDTDATTTGFQGTKFTGSFKRQWLHHRQPDDHDGSSPRELSRSVWLCRQRR